MTRLARIPPYAYAGAAALLAAAVFLAAQPQILSDAWSAVAGWLAAKWQRGVFTPGMQFAAFTMALVVMELFFLSWQKTTVFITFFKRSKSAIVDFIFTGIYFTAFHVVIAYFLTFGIAYAVVKLLDVAADRIGWARLDLPASNPLEIITAFIVFYTFSTFIGYWSHRLMHWRWFWLLHRFHHSAPDFNIFTNFRASPGDAFANIPGMSILFFVKVPDAALFATFVMISQLIATFQHSQLPWGFGWFGRWLIANPINHQIHHSVDPEHHHRNFSTVPLWDRMFGTYYGGPNRPTAYGIPGSEHLDRPMTQWFIDIFIFYREVWRSFAGTMRRTREALRRPQQQPVDAPALARPE